MDVQRPALRWAALRRSGVSARCGDPIRGFGGPTFRHAGEIGEICGIIN
jgi:hypothetical protein